MSNKNNERAEVRIMAEIKLVRVDYRLIHGQVATVWSKEANAQRIIICSDEVAKDQIRKTLLL